MSTSGNASRTRIFGAILGGVVWLIPASANADPIFTPIDISTHYNARIQTLQPSAATIPEGNVVFGGVPFQTGVGGNNIWWGEVALRGIPGFIDIPVGVSGVDVVHTLINTSYGRAGPPALASLEFFGTGGAYYKKDLIGDDDIRDHFFAFWTNSINNTTTVNVFTAGSGFLNESRVDKQAIDLPDVFLGETLEKIRVNDIGQTLVQAVILYGVTVESRVVVPEPASVSLFGLGVLGLAVCGACRRRILGRG